MAAVLPFVGTLRKPWHGVSLQFLKSRGPFRGAIRVAGISVGCMVGISGFLNFGGSLCCVYTVCWGYPYA